MSYVFIVLLMIARIVRILRLARCAIVENGNSNSDRMEIVHGVYVRKIKTVEKNILLINLRSYDVVFLKHDHLFYNVNILENINNTVIIYYGHRKSNLSYMPGRGG